MGVSASRVGPAPVRTGACFSSSHHSAKLSWCSSARSNATAWRLLLCRQVWPTAVRSETKPLPTSGLQRGLEPSGHAVLLTSRDARPNGFTLGTIGWKQVTTTRFDPACGIAAGFEPAPLRSGAWRKGQMPIDQLVLATSHRSPRQRVCVPCRANASNERRSRGSGPDARA